LLPERLLDLELQSGSVAPRYLTSRDHLWVEAVLDEITACLGRPCAEVKERMGQPPRRGERFSAWRALVQLLLKWHGFETRSARPPATLRQALFLRAGASPAGRPREEVLGEVAVELGLAPAVLARELYADLPEEQVLKQPREPLSVGACIERYNLALAQALLRRTERLQVRIDGNAKAVLRFARLQRLLCLAETADDGRIRLELSGPLALFHQTTKYGQAMAAWLPVLIRAPCWELEAHCILRQERWVWRATFHDPIGSTHAPVKRFDSAVEGKFFRDLRRTASEWQVLREADPVQVGRRILCPDFTLVHEDRGLRVPVEIVGFWTPEYLRSKIETLHELPPGKAWVVCLDQALAGAARSAGLDYPVFLFRRRIEVGAFLDFLEEWIAGRRPRQDTREEG
jgi:hypothetical protein